MMDDLQNDKLADLEGRMRLVENAVLELGLMSRTLKYGVLIVGASLGVEIQGLI